jgi:hypothetical protein
MLDVDAFSGHEGDGGSVALFEVFDDAATLGNGLSHLILLRMVVVAAYRREVKVLYLCDYIN